MKNNTYKENNSDNPPEFERLFSKARSTEMASSEKKEVWNKIHASLDTPIEGSDVPLTIPRRRPSEYQNVGDNKYSLLISTSLLFIILFGGSLSIGARNSLPGDVLYPVKINLNEKVQTFTSSTPENRAEIETIQAKARLLEAEQLVVTGKLDVDSQKQIEDNFNEHADNIVKNAITLKEEGKDFVAEEINEKFEKTLIERRDILADIEKKHSGATEALKSVNKSIRDALVSTSNFRSSSRIGSVMSKSSSAIFMSTSTTASTSTATSTLDSNSNKEQDEKQN